MVTKAEQSFWTLNTVSNFSTNPVMTDMPVVGLADELKPSVPIETKRIFDNKTKEAQPASNES